MMSEELVMFDAFSSQTYALYIQREFNLYFDTASTVPGQCLGQRLDNASDSALTMPQTPP